MKRKEEEQYERNEFDKVDFIRVTQRKRLVKGTSAGVREIRAVSARRDTSGGGRADEFVSDEKLRAIWWVFLLYLWNWRLDEEEIIEVSILILRGEADTTASKALVAMAKLKHLSLSFSPMDRNRILQKLNKIANAAVSFQLVPSQNQFRPYAHNSLISDGLFLSNFFK